MSSRPIIGHEKVGSYRNVDELQTKKNNDNKSKRLDVSKSISNLRRVGASIVPSNGKANKRMASRSPKTTLFGSSMQLPEPGLFHHKTEKSPDKKVPKIPKVPSFCMSSMTPTEKKSVHQSQAQMPQTRNASRSNSKPQNKLQAPTRNSVTIGPKSAIVLNQYIAELAGLKEATKLKEKKMMEKFSASRCHTRPQIPQFESCRKITVTEALKKSELGSNFRPSKGAPRQNRKTNPKPAAPTVTGIQTKNIKDNYSSFNPRTGHVVRSFQTRENHNEMNNGSSVAVQKSKFYQQSERPHLGKSIKKINGYFIQNGFNLNAYEKFKGVISKNQKELEVVTADPRFREENALSSNVFKFGKSLDAREVKQASDDAPPLAQSDFKVIARQAPNSQVKVGAFEDFEAPKENKSQNSNSHQISSMFGKISNKDICTPAVSDKLTSEEAEISRILFMNFVKKGKEEDGDNSSKAAGLRNLKIVIERPNQSSSPGVRKSTAEPLMKDKMSNQKEKIVRERPPIQKKLSFENESSGESKKVAKTQDNQGQKSTPAKILPDLNRTPESSKKNLRFCTEGRVSPFRSNVEECYPKMVESAHFELKNGPPKLTKNKTMDVQEFLRNSPKLFPASPIQNKQQKSGLVRILESAPSTADLAQVNSSTEAFKLMKKIRTFFHDLPDEYGPELPSFFTELEYYRVERKIGKGCFGNVYLATQILTGLPVALKVIDKASIAEQQIHAKIVLEISILKAVAKEAHLAKLFEVFEDEVYLYLVLEYLPNGDLISFFRGKSMMTEPQLRAFFIKVVLSVRNLHRHGIIHRDIKMDNILLDRNYDPILCDFGISSVWDPKRPIKDTGGTPAYLAPEVIRAKGEICFKSDVWSLGVLLFALTYGYVPFEGQDVQDLYRNILIGKYEQPTHIEASPELRDLISRTICLSLTKRISVEEILEHPWFGEAVRNIIIEKSENALQMKKEEKVKRDKVIRQLNDFGFGIDFVCQSLNQNAFNHATSCYYNVMAWGNTPI